MVSRWLLLASWHSVIEAHDPNELLRANKVAICRVRVKDLGDFRASRLLLLRVYLLPFGSHCAWSRVELRDVEHWELVASYKLACLLMVRTLFSREPTDDICSQGHCRHGIAQEVTHFVELFDGVFAIHLVEHVIRAALDGDVKELVDARMPHNVCHSLQVL